MATANLFATAKKAPTVAKAAKAAKTVTEITGLEMYACYDAIEKYIKGHKEAAKTEIMAIVTPMFVETGAKTGVKPESFDAKEGIATGSMQCRKRGTNSALTELEQATLKTHGIPMEEVADQVETFIFNPALADRIKTDPKLAQAISKALANIKDIGVDPIQLQEATTKFVVNDASVNAVFKKPKETIAELIDIVTTPAIRPKVNGDDNIFVAFEKVTNFLLITGQKPEAKEGDPAPSVDLAENSGVKRTLQRGGPR